MRVQIWRVKGQDLHEHEARLRNGKVIGIQNEGGNEVAVQLKVRCHAVEAAQEYVRGRTTGWFGVRST